ncbi:hypothetical protein DENIS_3543 [Desulfonema ishimotonii]|uniref:ABC transporter substrate-binding protein n=1 Tax=Desulfonema ishimotonii TaxID=45657 RepID=A0A401G028_9BACT|nr:ABC transporter substrate binding protein [Desulfonema ishimotonii]GBC62571.1 hypothetical protein DENIS_3543 [Desulfonema ishimotonii]
MKTADGALKASSYPKGKNGLSGKPGRDGSASASPGTAASLTCKDWFSLSAESAAHWRLSPAPEDGMAFVLRPRKEAAPKERYRIMVLFPKKSSAYDTAMETILSVFRDKNICAEFVGVNFFMKEEAGAAALRQAEADPCDLIFSMGSGSTDFVHKNHSAGKVPVVSVCAKDPVLLGQIRDYDTGSGNHMAFTSLNVPVALQMAYLRKLIPDLRNIAVIYARKNRSAVITQFRPLRDMAGRQGINVMEIVVEDRKNARAEIESKMPAALESVRKSGQEKNSLIWITGSTSVFREIETINRNAGVIPVLSAVPDVVTEGDNSAVLSIGVSFENNAYLAAIYAIRILREKAEAGDLRVGLVSPPDIAVNFKKAREIGLLIPFRFFELASYVYDHEGKKVRMKGQKVTDLAPQP